MINLIAGAFRTVLKSAAVVVACGFWFVFGFLIWIRVLVISFGIYSAHLVLAPFGQRADGQPSQNFDRALKLWGRGFERILASLKDTTDDDGENLWDDNSSRGCFPSLMNFLWQSIATILFWAPIILTLHYSGLVRVGLVDRGQQILSELTGITEPPAVIEADCLGLQAIQRHAAALYVTTEPVNVRRGPGVEHERLGRLNGNQVVSVVGRSPSGEWSLIEEDGRAICFVSSDYLRPYQR